MRMFTRPIFAGKDFNFLKEAWLTRWNRPDSVNTTHGNADLWLNAVLDTLQKRGDDMITRELQIEEQRLISKGLGKDLVEAIIKLTVASPEEGWKAMLAGSDVRERAVMMVSAYELETKNRLEDDCGSN